MSANMLCMMCAGITLVAMLGSSIWMAYHVVHTTQSSHRKPKADSEVLLAHLKLTN